MPRLIPEGRSAAALLSGPAAAGARLLSSSSILPFAALRRTPMSSTFMSGRAARLAAALCTVLLPTLAAAAPADVFRQWSAEPWLERQITLGELGFQTPIALQGSESDSRREFFLPVPAGLPLQGATLQLDADYLRGDGGRSVFVLSLDGYPVSSRRFNDDRGDASLAIGVDAAARNSGFVRVGASWNSTISDVVCADQRAPGNVLRILPTSRLRYRIDRSRLSSLATVWSTLPPRPVLMVAGRNLSQPAYDAAWRIGLALERAGKRVQVRALPAVGDAIEVTADMVPADLRGLPAFGALAGAGASGAAPRSHRIGDAAELGALLALGVRGPLRADVAVADPALGTAVNGALDALAAQMASDPAAAAAFSQWRGGAFGLAAQPVASGEVTLRSLGGVPVVAIAADAGAQAALLFDSLWKPVAGGSAIAPTAIARPRPDDRILLSQLGGKPGSIDVGNRSDWTATFGIEDVAGNGRAPRALVFDLSATPDSGGAGPVASVYLNDYLLSAQTLTPDGKPQRLRAAVPQHMLAPRNVVRVTFLRQLTKPRCHDQQTAYPVGVLPTSHVELGKVAAGNDFSGIARRFTDGGEVLLPAAWLADAERSLPRTIRLADAAGVSLAGTTLTVVATDAAAKPVSPAATFLALDLPVEKGTARVDPSKGRMELVNGKTPLIDVSRLTGVGVLDVAESGGKHGVVWRPLGADVAVPLQPVQLGRGDVALLNASGVTLEIDSRDPRGAQLADDANPESVLTRYAGWWIALIALLLLVLLAARIAQVRKQRRARPVVSATGPL
ncbi:hypothetical protein ACFX58_13610 [Sphingomonas sp. NCPPB 2930]